MASPPTPVLLRHLRQLAGWGPDDDLTDAQLLQRFVDRRDPTAFEQLVRRHGPMVLALCRRLLGHEQDAEDAFQATFLVLAQKAGAVRNQASVGGWLFSVACRLARHVRARRDRLGARETSVAIPDSLDRLPDPNPMPADPQEVTLTAELRAVLDEELDRLPDKYRAPLVICYLQGRTHQQGARQLGLPLGTFKSRVRRALVRLQRLLGRRGLAVSTGVLLAAMTQAASATVPAALMQRTCQAGLAHAAGQSVGLLASPEAVILARGLVHTMAVSRLRFALLLTLLTGLAGLSSALAWRAASPTEDPAALGREEEPPLGALARPGTLRLRHGGPVLRAAFLPDGKTLMTAGEDRKVRFWDLATGRETGFLNADVRPPELRNAPCFHGPDRGAFKVAVSADGKRLATSCCSPTVVVWDLDSRKELRRVRTILGDFPQRLALSHDGKLLAARGNDEAPLVWDVSTGRLQHPVRRARPSEGMYPGTVGWGSSAYGVFEFSADNRSVLSVELTRGPCGQATVLREWDVAGIKDVRNRLASERPRHALGRLSPDRQRMASREYQVGIRLTDLTDDREIAVLNDADDPVAGYAFHPDGRHLLTLNASGAVVCWDAANGNRRQELVRLTQPPRPRACVTPHVMMVVSPDARRLAILEWENAVRVVDLTTGEGILERALAARQAAAETRVTRAVEVLERLGTSEARELLRSLAKGEPGTTTTTEAADALRRLTR